MFFLTLSSVLEIFRCFLALLISLVLVEELKKIEMLLKGGVATPSTPPLDPPLMLVAIHLPEPQPFVFFLRVCLFAFVACAASSLLLVF